MIYCKLWIVWISLQSICSQSRKKDLQEHSSFRDTLAQHTQENPGSIDGSELTEGQKEAILQLHNAFRSMVKPPSSNMLKMLWDTDLEKIAKDFSSKCIVAHNPDRHRLAKNYDWVGENIAWGTGSCGDKDCGDVYEGVKRWFSESNSYNYVTGQCSGKCTLYTQMVWWESNKLGCGAKKCGDRTILVCNYAPGGNYVGQRPYKSGSPCSDCPSGMSCEDNLCVDKTENVKLGSKKDGTDLSSDMLKAAKMSATAYTTPIPTTFALHSPSGLPVITAPTYFAPTTATPHALPAGWNELPVQLTQVDSGMTSAIWGMNASHSLFIVEDFIKLVPVDGTMHHISVGQAGVWAVGLLGNVFFRKGLTIENPKGLFWEKIHGNLKQIDSGPPGIVWGVNRYDGIFCRIGIRMDKPGGTGWMRIEGNMKYVSCGEFGCWAVDNRGDIYFRTGIAESKPEGSAWKLVPGRLRMIESGPLGLTVGLDLNSNLMIRSGVSQDKGEGVSWEKTDLVLAHVTVGESGIIGILPDGTLAIRQDLRKYIAQQTSVVPTATSIPTKDFPLDSFTSPTIATIPILKVASSPPPVEGFRHAALEAVGLSRLPESTTAAKALQDYNNLSAPSLKSPDEPEKLHLTPEMASKILKLIEAKGNELEVDHHRAAVESTSRNESVSSSASIHNTGVAKSDQQNTPETKTNSKDEPTKSANTDKTDTTQTKATSKNKSTEEPKALDKVDSEHSDSKSDSEHAAKEHADEKEHATTEEKDHKVTEHTDDKTHTEKEHTDEKAHTEKEHVDEKPHTEKETTEEKEHTVKEHSEEKEHTEEKAQTEKEHAPEKEHTEAKEHRVPEPSPHKDESDTETSTQRKPEEEPEKSDSAHHDDVDDQELILHQHKSEVTHKPLATKAPTHHKKTHTTPKHTKHHTSPTTSPTMALPKITHAPHHMHHPVHHDDKDVQYPQPKNWRRPAATTHAHLEQKHVQPKTHSRPRTHPPTTQAQSTITTKFNPLKTQTHRIWVHSLATSAPAPTAHAVKNAPVVAEPRPTVGYDRPRMKAAKDMYNGVAGHIAHQLPPNAKVRPPGRNTPAPLSWTLARSCCTIPDSVCPIPNDCVGYIECEGYRGRHKDCERGKVFNPVTNICDYPRNVECGEGSKGAPQAVVNHPPPAQRDEPGPIVQNYAQHAPVLTSEVASAAVPAVAPVAPSADDAKDAVKAGQPPRVNSPHQDFDGVLREVWFGLGLSPLLTMLTNNPRFPTHPDEYIVLDKFEAPPNAGDGYGQRLSTYYKAPQTGEYIFYISCDNECELWVSPDAEEIHSNLILELKRGHYTSFRQWHKYPEEQTSRPIYLQQDSFYFMESFMKEGTGGDDLSVGVKLPNGEFDLPISSNLHLIPGDSIDITTVASRKPGQPVLASAAPDPAKVFHPPVIPNMAAAFHPESMGPQPGQTVEQWLSANHGSPVISEAIPLNSGKNIPAGASMYSSYPNNDDMEAFEQQHLTLKKRRSQIPHPWNKNITTVR